MFGHGFLTREDATEVYYQINEFYTPERSSGLRYDDPSLAIEWPGEINVVSEKDLKWESLR